MVYGKRLRQEMIRKHILSSREHYKKDLLEKEKQQMSERKLTFNIICYPAFQNVRSIMEELRILSIPNKEHRKVFRNVLVAGFWNDKSYNDYLFRASCSGYNYKRKHRAFRKGNQNVSQKHFLTHYCLDGHSGINDWNFVVFEQCETH